MEDIVKTERLEIGGSLALEVITYETFPGIEGPPCDVSFEFIEHSPDHWYSDRETSVTIDAAMALKIIEMLNRHFWKI